MAMLGDLLASARRSAAGIEPWIREHEPTLASRLAVAAATEGETPTGYVRAAVADFSRFASEEDWATLVSRLHGQSDPGTVCLLAMLEWRLAASEPATATIADSAEGPVR